MTNTTAFRISAIVGMLGVALGAFGAHGMKAAWAALPVEEALKRADWWKTAVMYHLPHAVVLLVLAKDAGLRLWSWLMMLAGVAIFSGTLYAMSAGGPKWLGAITPIGGTLMIAGWLWMAFEKPRPAA